MTSNPRPGSSSPTSAQSIGSLPAARLAAQRYADLGLAVIPLKPGTKLPDLSKWEQYQKRKPEPAELDGWFASPRNIGVVCGAVSGGLLVLDFDDLRAFPYFFTDRRELPGRTLVVETGKGVHAYVRVKGGGTPKGASFHKKADSRKWFPLDVKGDGGYVVAPPSIHPSGKAYRFLGDANTILEVDRNRLDEQIARCVEEWPLVEKVLSAWTEGTRHNLALGFAKLLRFRRKFSEDRVLDVVRRLCAAAGDEQVEDRIAAARDTLRKGFEETAAKTFLGETLYADLLALAPRPQSSPRRKGGDDEESVEFGTRLELPDGRLAEEIFAHEGERFAVYDPAKDSVEVVPEVLVEGRVVRPWPVSRELRECLVLPDGAEEYGTTSGLLDEMEAFADSLYDPVKERPLWRMWIRGALVSWVLGPAFEKSVEKYASIFHVVGPSETGKGRALTVSRFLFCRALFFQKTTRVPSLFRTIDPWQGTLILDEADLLDSGESADFIEFLNARATGSVIPRYSTERGTTDLFMSFGNTIVATRKPYSDDGVNSRSVPLRAEPTAKDVPLIMTAEQVEQGRVLQRKLLLWRFRQVARIRRGDLKVPSRLDIAGVRSFRVREAMLILSALGKDESKLTEDLEQIARELDRRLVVERAASPEGMILNVVYALLDEARVELRGTGYVLIETRMREDKDQDGPRVEVDEPVTLTRIMYVLGKAFQTKEIAAMWRGLNHATLERWREGKKLFRGVLLVPDPARLDAQFLKYVVGGEARTAAWPQRALENFGGPPRETQVLPEQVEHPEQPRSGPPDSVPDVPDVPGKPISDGGVGSKNSDGNAVLGGEGQDPDYMAGLQRGLDLRRTDPGRPPSWAAKDLEKELRARGHVPDAARLLAGLEQGLRGKDGGEHPGETKGAS